MNTYYYCVTDPSGQRTGEVRDIKLTTEQITTDGKEIKKFGNTFLYNSKQEADRASLN